MELPKEQEVKVEEFEVDQDPDDEEEGDGKNRINWDQQLLNACKKGELQLAEKALNKKANVNIEGNVTCYAEPKKKWTPLVWASCKGFLPIVKLLLQRGAHTQYTTVDPNNRLVIMGTNRQVRPTPLQWACFKGHFQIFLLLLKAGLHWEDVDPFGNNSVNLSAAGNHPQIFKIFLQYGVLVNVKNSRGHVVRELSTNPEILHLTELYEKATHCHISKLPFKDTEVKYWCWICGNFFKPNCFKSEWVLPNAKSQERTLLDGRCNGCWKDLENHTADLTKAMESYDERVLTDKLKEKADLHVKFEVKFMEKALILQEKLRTQNEILKYVGTLARVPNYKIILKAVDTIESMLKGTHVIKLDSRQRNVLLDDVVVNTINKEKERLVAERNLRYLLDNIDAAVAKREEVKQLEDIFAVAEQKKVAAEYLDVANELKVKMGKAILVQDIYKLFVEYPPRPDPYPEPMVIDFKTKKPLDPATKKPTDPVNLLPKKKGKKDPKYTIPEWATDLKVLNDKIKELEQLVKLKEELNLSPEFVQKCGQSIALMKRESRYRRDMDELQRMVDEANKKPKK